MTQQIEHLKVASIQTVIPKNQAYVVGSKDESFGNQVCQWDGDVLKFRVPACLEAKFGKHVQTKLGNFDRNINRLPKDGSRTWHFYHKNGKWNAAVQFTPAPVKRVSRHSAYGCIGIDMNPGSIGWAYVDRDGNLQANGQIPLQMGLPSGKQDAQIVDACLQLATLADTFSCPVVCEELDFSTKKEQLSERGNALGQRNGASPITTNTRDANTDQQNKGLPHFSSHSPGRKYARMLSGWAYSRFYELLGSILSNRGIYLMQVNPAYTSVIGLVKYARQYGLASDEAAAMAIARRGMRLTENIPDSITAYLDVKSGKHVWSLWNQLNTLIKKSSIRRHGFYAISNWESLVKQWTEQSVQSKRKC